MRPTTLTERQMAVLMNVGRAIDAALPEFRGRTPADIATAAHAALTAMAGLQLPALQAPSAPVKPAASARQKRRKAKAKPTGTATKTDRTVSIMSVLGKSKKPLAASDIAEKLGISGQGLGPVLNKMHSDGAVTKKEVDGSYVWGSKHLNGKASHAPN